MKRATFSDIVQILEAELTQAENDEYKELEEQYASMRELMEDPVTQLKRSAWCCKYTSIILKIQLRIVPKIL